ncbi:General transcription factor IIE subunit 1 [Halotydeus destructor]|nr:General transcription factor IIE subunit 1 [Halotydeus destructor]
MIKSRLRMETGLDGKATKQNYYYVNYKAFVNVVKYKLDHMRRKIETEERDLTSRASFICTQCKKTYTDLEADQLCDLTTGEFRCSYCGALVDEDPNVMPKADSRLILAKFNEQIETLYILLKEVEDIVLPTDILEPEPMDIAVKTESSSSGQHNRREFGRNNVEYDAALFANNNLTVKIEPNAHESIEADSIKKEPKEEKKAKKEQPAWMTGSTIFEESNSLVNITNGSDNVIINQAPQTLVEDSTAAKEILEALLMFEKAQETTTSALSFLNSHQNNEEMNGIVENGHSNAEDILESDEDMDADDSPLVRVAGEIFRLSDVDEDHVERMSQREKEEYIRITQEIYAHMYDI